jgi:nucleoid-associated protein YgaU
MKVQTHFQSGKLVMASSGKFQYIVEKNDNLWTIAKNVYGDSKYWSYLYNNNKSLIGPNPDRIIPGQKLAV